MQDTAHLTWYAYAWQVSHMAGTVVPLLTLGLLIFRAQLM